MSNHVATITKDEGRCSFSRKALSVFMAVLLAFLMMPMVPAESALAVPSDANTWKNATVEYTVDPNEDEEYFVEYTGQATEMAVVSVTDVYGNLLSGSDYDVVYYSDDASGALDAGDVKTTVADDGAEEEGAAPANPGRYFITVWQSGTTADANLASAASKPVIVQSFEIGRADFEGIFAYEVKDGGAAAADDEVDDTAFVYNAKAQAVGFAVDGKAIDPAYYTVVWNTTAEQAASAGAAPKAAGEYVANVIGQGNSPYAGATATVPVTVEKFDIADITVGDVASASANTGFRANTNLFYEGKQLGADLYAEIVTDGTVTPLSWVKPDGTVVTGASAAVAASDNLGAYTYSFAPKADAKDNYVGEKQLSFNVVEKAYAKTDATYDDDPLSEDTILINMSEDEALDPSLFAIGGLDQKKGDFSVVVTKDGEAVTSYTEPGDYVATVTVKIPADYSKGGKFEQKFTVQQGVVSADTIFVSADGKNVLSNAEGSPTEIAEYDGAAVPTVVVVKAGDKVLAAEADYAVEVAAKNGSEWTAVDAAVDAGTYRVKVTPSVGYGGEDAAQSFYFAIDKLALTGAKSAAENGIVYTGEPVSPSFIGLDADENEFALTGDDITVKYYKGKTNDNGETWTKGDEVAYDKIVDAGVYLADIDSKATSKNFEGLDADKVKFEIVTSIAFADVAADAWYADAVALASQTEPVKYDYMNGIPGTNLFLPEGQITRAQVAQVLYNMAGPDLAVGGVYPTQFSDVEADAWYAAPIFWASQAGIVTGIGDTGTFAPNDPVTREQVATMLWRYMKAQGKDVSGSADLAAYADGSSVSGWAAEAMAWAVDAEVFGVGTDVLRPQDDMSRAEMAATAVRVQPDGAIVRS